MKLIYRKTDRLIVGSVAPPQPEALELQNILRSELRGVAGDYAFTADVPTKTADQMYQVDPGGAVVVVPNPTATKRNADRASALTKLQALGLTRDEIETI